MFRVYLFPNGSLVRSHFFLLPPKFKKKTPCKQTLTNRFPDEVLRELLICAIEHKLRRGWLFVATFDCNGWTRSDTIWILAMSGSGAHESDSKNRYPNIATSALGLNGNSSRSTSMVNTTQPNRSHCAEHLPTVPIVWLWMCARNRSVRWVCTYSAYARADSCRVPASSMCTERLERAIETWMNWLNARARARNGSLAYEQGGMETKWKCWHIKRRRADKSRLSCTHAASFACELALLGQAALIAAIYLHAF